MCDTVVVASSSDGARVRVSTMVIAMNVGREEASIELNMPWAPWSKALVSGDLEYSF